MSALKDLALLPTLLVVSLMFTGMSVGCFIGTAEAQVIEDSFVATGTSRLVVNTDNGGIKVTSSDGDAIQVTATIRDPERVEYSAAQEGDTVRIVAKVDEGSNFLTGEGDRGAEIVVSVPRGIDLDLEASNGAIEVTGIDGTVVAKTSNGRVSLSDITGDVEVETSNGRVELVDMNGEVKAETSNGAISFSGELPAGSENSLKTSNGSIEVSLLDTPGVELDAATSNGQVRSSLAISDAGEDKENELKGTIGNGGSKLEIRTSNGSITVK